MRICHVVHSLAVGGAEMLVANIAREQRKTHGLGQLKALL